MKLNLGCGNDIQKGYKNHDLIKHRDEIDYVFDLNYHTWKTAGRLIPVNGSFEDNIVLFDEVRAFDVIEHVDDVINFMNNCWDILKENGILYIKACGYQNPSFHIDITHKRAFHPKSFDYFDLETEIGKEYSYYTNKKWKIVENGLDRKNNIMIKLCPIK